MNLLDAIRTAHPVIKGIGAALAFVLIMLFVHYLRGAVEWLREEWRMRAWIRNQQVRRWPWER